MSFYDNLGSINPPRLAAPEPHYSAGRNLYPQRYLIGWTDGVVKVGSTWNGRRRWGRFLSRGGTMLDLAHYPPNGQDLHAEVWLQRQLSRRFRPAFQEKSESIPYMGNSGGGYLECYAVPVEDWPALIDLARREDALV